MQEWSNQDMCLSFEDRNGGLESWRCGFGQGTSASWVLAAKGKRIWVDGKPVYNDLTLELNSVLPINTKYFLLSLSYTNCSRGVAGM